MSNKLKSQGKLANKLSKREPQCQCWNTNRHLAVSFEFLTDDKEFSFAGLEASKVRMVIPPFEDLLKNITSKSIVELAKVGKEQFGGFETLRAGIIKKGVCKNYRLAPDAKVHVFRFCGGSCRMICAKAEQCDKLYLLGFDWKFKAYDHGR